jgi:sialic acid synthase SpsE
MPTLLVAEIGGNHGGDMELASRMVRAAAKARAGAVKFQAYCSPRFMSPLSPFYKELENEELPYGDLANLVAEAKDYGLLAGLTAFDEEGIEMAQEAGADFIKISSGDITHHRLLEKAARTDKPLFISTGASTQAEVDAARHILGPARKRRVFLQCTSLYPTPLASVDMAVMDRWLHSGMAAGYSDHTMGTAAANLAIALGAFVLEKHFTTDTSLPGGDNSISALPADFAELAQWAALCAAMRGEDSKRIQPDEISARPIIRRAVVARRDLPEGWRLTENDVTLMRPPQAEGALGPNYLGHVVGRILARAIGEGDLISLARLADV